MPFKSKKQARFFGMCSTPEGRRKARDKCPDKKTVKKFFAEDSRAKKRQKRRKR